MARTPDAQELGLAFVTPDGVVRLVIAGGRCLDPELAPTPVNEVQRPDVSERPAPRLRLVRGRLRSMRLA